MPSARTYATGPSRPAGAPGATRTTGPAGAARPNRSPNDVHAVAAHPVLVTRIRVDRTRDRSPVATSAHIALCAYGGVAARRAVSDGWGCGDQSKSRRGCDQRG
jgi:hypothetical protein